MLALAYEVMYGCGLYVKEKRLIISMRIAPDAVSLCIFSDSATRNIAKRRKMRRIRCGSTGCLRRVRVN